MKKRTIEAIIESTNNIDYEIFKFEELLKEYEKEDSTEYIKMLYGIRFGVMLELEEKIEKLKKKLRKDLIHGMVTPQTDVET